MAYAYSSRRISGRKPGAPTRKMGTWKLAYADFLTALCAFFLVMWIVHGVTAEDKSELAKQFGADIEVSAASTAALATSAERLADQLRSDSGLLAYGASVSITADPDFIRIDLTDMATRPLFETGDGGLNETGQALTSAAGQAVAFIDLPIVIEGHTDSNPSLTPGYSNWEISSDRANSARRILEEVGVSPARIRGVTGLADTRPLFPESSALPANRRISIVLVLSDHIA